MDILFKFYFDLGGKNANKKEENQNRSNVMRVIAIMLDPKYCTSL